MATYSTYEAKAKLSQILRQVRAGQRVVIAHRGRPIAEVRPLARLGTLTEALTDLEDTGALSPAPAGRPRLTAIAKRRGGLARFLASRE
jgi:prevent-host-death family protein